MTAANAAGGRRSGPMGVGIIGAGNISDEYLRSLTSYPDIQVLGIADLDLERAAAQAAKYGVPFSGSTADLLALPDIELVVNLTVPAVHASVALEAIGAGKHVWGEKPFALDRASAAAILSAAEAAGVVVGNAPDTVLGEAVQHSHRLLRAGRIGEPQTVLTLMQGPGPDAWHPRPQFLFARGAGPLFDIGPYYFATLVQLLGGIESVQAVGHRAQAERVIGSGPDAGASFPVEVFTHVSVLTRFRSGVVGTSIYSFDSPVRRQLFEITGSRGTLEVPVSGFDGPSRVFPAGGSDAEWERIDPPGVPQERGVGVLEMARAIRAGRPPRADGLLAAHVLDAMLAVEESIESGLPVTVRSEVGDIDAVDVDWDPAAATLHAEIPAEPGLHDPEPHDPEPRAPHVHSTPPQNGEAA
ncbi:Gfo/Idh/MocA family protein [Plantibacter sp. Mn2098]|uniref:Gfo/Idh/MocA family protein n=1 Tax=Plantibacter sp. Mn2098 TaxID=3395266 RepID=UPI003BDB59B3